MKKVCDTEHPYIIPHDSHHCIQKVIQYCEEYALVLFSNKLFLQKQVIPPKTSFFDTPLMHDTFTLTHISIRSSISVMLHSYFQITYKYKHILTTSNSKAQTVNSRCAISPILCQQLTHLATESTARSLVI